MLAFTQFGTNPTWCDVTITSIRVDVLCPLKSIVIVTMSCIHLQHTRHFDLVFRHLYEALLADAAGVGGHSVIVIRYRWI